MPGEIIVVPFPGQGHIFPATELSHRLAALNYDITLLLPNSNPSPSAPLHPSIRILECYMPHPPAPPPQNPGPFPGPHHFPDHCAPVRDLLATRDRSLPPPICAVLDVMMSPLIASCQEFGIPAVSFFTSSACSTALEHATWKLSSEAVLPDRESRTVTIPGLPEDMALTISDLTRRELPPPSMPGPRERGVPPPGLGNGGGPTPSATSGGGTPLPQHRTGHPIPGGPPPPPGPGPFSGLPPPPPPRPEDCDQPLQPPWGVHGRGPRGIGETDGAVALLFNTCDDLERPFLDYVAKEVKKPVWGVGPLLPSNFWSAESSLVRDEQTRAKRESNVTEEDVLQWLDSKPRGSVIYVSFGSVVGPSNADIAVLAAGLEESNRPFIWAIQAGTMRHGPPGQANPVQNSEELPRGGEEGRGLVIRGWAPQLLILSHPSTGGFVTHCGWNSTVEAIGRGVPMLTWPKHGDQLHNAKLVTDRLRVGHTIRKERGEGEGVTKEDVVRGIERLMTDEEVRERAASARRIFGGGFPESSASNLEAFLDFVVNKKYQMS